MTTRECDRPDLGPQNEAVLEYSPHKPQFSPHSDCLPVCAGAERVWRWAVASSPVTLIPDTHTHTEEEEDAEDV